MWMQKTQVMRAQEERARLRQPARPGSHGPVLPGPGSSPSHLDCAHSTVQDSFRGQVLPGGRNHSNSHDFTANTWSEKKKRCTPISNGCSRCQPVKKDGRRRAEREGCKGQGKVRWKEERRKDSKNRQEGGGKGGRWNGTRKGGRNKKLLAQSALNPDSRVHLVSNRTFVPVCHFAFAWHQWPTYAA